MPQRHDIAWKKRQPANKPERMGSTEAMARRLVSLGLASPQILDASRAPRTDNQRTNRRSN